MSQNDTVGVDIEAAEAASPLTLSTVTDNAAWVVQGVAPSNEQYRMTDDGDGVWYARTVNEYLSETLTDWETPLDALLRESVYTVMDLYSNRVEDIANIDLDTLPSAMVACLRWDDRAERIEYFSIGDCAIVVETASATHRICATDASLHDPDFDAEDQWRLSFSPEAIDYARHGRLDNHDVTGAYLFPTAVDAAVEVYSVFDSWDTLIEQAETHGVDAVLDEVAALYTDNVENSPMSNRPGVQDLSLLSIRLP